MVQPVYKLAASVKKNLAKDELHCCGFFFALCLTKGPVCVTERWRNI